MAGYGDCVQAWPPTARMLRPTTCANIEHPANPDYVPISVHANGVDSCVVCSSALAPSYDGPYCSNLALPPCTYKQYADEAITLHTSLPGVSVDPLDVEEHLAKDYGCGISAALIPHYTTAQIATDIAYGIMAPLVFVVFALVIMAYIEGNNRGPIQPS